MIEKKGNYDSCEAQQVRQQSEFLKRVHDFAEYMHKEYIAESDGEMSLFISANDSTLGDDKIGRMQCVMGQEALVVTGLASFMEEGENRELFRAARRMADDYDDLPQRRKELRRQRRVLYTLISITALWTCCTIPSVLCWLRNRHRLRGLTRWSVPLLFFSFFPPYSLGVTVLK